MRFCDTKTRVFMLEFSAVFFIFSSNFSTNFCKIKDIKTGEHHLPVHKEYA